jgi:hypothetical protein
VHCATSCSLVSHSIILSFSVLIMHGSPRLATKALHAKSDAAGRVACLIACWSKRAGPGWEEDIEGRTWSARNALSFIPELIMVAATPLLLCTCTNHPSVDRDATFRLLCDAANQGFGLGARPWSTTFPCSSVEYLLTYRFAGSHVAVTFIFC